MQTFFELIRVALGNADRLSHIPKPKEWQMLYDMTKKQSLVGICFAGVQRLVNSEKQDYYGMPEMLYLTWMGMAAKIQQRNELMNGKTKEALDFFREKSFPCQVLKGQGIGTLYRVYDNDNDNRDLSLLRQSGDIDVWAAGGREKIYQLSREVLGKITGANYHHIHFPMWEDPEIELHIYPSFLSSPRRNRNLHKFCKLYEPKDDEQDFPSTAFNLVFIMLHCYRHLCGHGVGMRQVMDYYFVLLQSGSNSLSGLSGLRVELPQALNKLNCEALNYKQESMKWITALGMRRFAPALMWVMKVVFGLEDEYLLCEPDEKDGRFLLSEIMQTGNMGHADERVDRSKLNSAFGRYIYNFKRDMHVMRICPHEALWEPWFNLVLYMRRKFIWSRKYDLK